MNGVGEGDKKTKENWTSLKQAPHLCEQRPRGNMSTAACAGHTYHIRPPSLLPSALFFSFFHSPNVPLFPHQPRVSKKATPSLYQENHIVDVCDFCPTSDHVV